MQIVAEVVGGRLTDVPDPEALVAGPAVFDSRQAKPGSLFIALAGTTRDGHDYAEQAAANGAVAALATRPVGAPAIVVDDVLAAFARLGRYLVAHTLPDTQVVAITGSAGKTSTKDFIAQLLPAAGPTVATPQSFNNEIGLPLTITTADPSTRFLVLEMGARKIGHIRTLTRIAPPGISVVTNVGTAHVGEFGGQDNIARAKGEIVEALPEEGLAVLNADDPRVHAMAERTTARVITYGLAEAADIRATEIVLDEYGRPSYTLHTPEGTAPVRLQFVGRPQVHNSLAAAAVAREAGLGAARTADLLSAATPQSHWRMETHTRADGVTVINDAYNANPDSMRSSLDALAAMTRGHDQRSIAVLGQMNELGDDTRTAHEDVGRHAAGLRLNQIIAVGGDEAGWIQQAARDAGAKAVHLPDQDAALHLLRSTLRAGDVVLVKASRGVQLQQLAEALVQPDPEPAGA
ncbi:UDP-N-acetylmuramoyl-tripeptide--D-alanyl-D-alanine ligase [Streptomyces sp. TRM S81-3]|uniref:UDP-N-acetylmuramoyl-tripeptide--D-alanyl-D-alanine ligase n=1 Tax=Streptomyces griseicoloratus TaxID=2752516 RepID=A0A926QSL4_9ACTN|nr:UDP-N-acetylmuramoyl-tripeptide--D-alanyl-D-alanine ligase [Streptomyces griseicoloratus]MBD0421885.1 UDP-N-acetylmuramoyl-tripeptide--D-alanyl-D-alanine ligase [Streptomyces griseicoloratus]